jgi:hypothetical protein
MANSGALERPKGSGLNLKVIMSGDLEWTSAHDCSARPPLPRHVRRDLASTGWHLQGVYDSRPFRTLQPVRQRQKGA